MLCPLKPVFLEYSFGSDFVFTCGTNDSSLDIIWFIGSNIAASVLNEQLAEGGSASKAYWYIGTLTN